MHLERKFQFNPHILNNNENCCDQLELFDIFIKEKERNLIKIKNVKEIGHMISFK